MKPKSSRFSLLGFYFFLISFLFLPSINPPKAWSDTSGFRSAAQTSPSPEPSSSPSPGQKWKCTGKAGNKNSVYAFTANEGTFQGDCTPDAKATDILLINWTCVRNGVQQLLSDQMVCHLTNRFLHLCGDGIIQAPYEKCDEGNILSGDGCNNHCMIEDCGDGIVQTG